MTEPMAAWFTPLEAYRTRRITWRIRLMSDTWLLLSTMRVASGFIDRPITRRSDVTRVMETPRLGLSSTVTDGYSRPAMTDSFVYMIHVSILQADSSRRGETGSSRLGSRRTPARWLSDSRIALLSTFYQAAISHFCMRQIRISAIRV